MSDLWTWVTIVGLTAATLLTRAGFLVFGHRVQLPVSVERALRYAPACALSAIVVPDLLFAQGRLDLTFGNDRLLAAVAAALFFAKTRNMLWTIVFGMVVFTGLRLYA